MPALRAVHGGRFRALLCLVALWWMPVVSACRPFVPQPTATPILQASPLPPATATLIVPSPPPPATLTALIRAYRRTRTPEPLPTASPQTPDTPVVQTPVPQVTEAATVTPSPTLAGVPTVRLIPEVAEPGARVEVHGAEWSPGSFVSIRLGPSLEAATGEEARVLVAADGSFVASFNVPTAWTTDSLIVLAESLDATQRAVARLYLALPTATSTPTPSPTWTPVPSPTPQITGWRGEYFANRNLQGAPKLVRDDPSVEFAWYANAPAPGLPADNFSVRWTRTVDLVPGGYRFQVRVDDGVRVWVNDQLLIDEWHVSAPVEYSADWVVGKGPVELRVEYFDAGGNAEIRFTWDYLGRFPDWRGSYYNNRTLSGVAALVRNDPAIDFNWGEGSPAPEVHPDNFSVRWTRSVDLTAGTYRFHAQADDGVRVWVDGRLVIDEWHVATGEVDYTADVNLMRGTHDLRVEYFEAGGKAEVYVWWENLSAYTDWRGAYYANRLLAGRPAFVRNDREINFDWGGGGPNGIGPDNFSVRWTRRQSFEGGVYRFFARHDDGVRVWVDGELIIDEWYETGPVIHSADVALIAGGHELRVDYFEGGGGASIRVWWERLPHR